VTGTGFFFTASIWDRIAQEEAFFRIGTGYSSYSPSLDYMPFGTELEVDVGLGMNPRISLSLQAPYREGISMMQSTLFASGNVLKVRFGYTAIGWQSPLYAGVIKLPSVNIGQDGLQATIETEAAGAMAMSRETSYDWHGTRWYVLNVIASMFGWMLLIEDSDIDGLSDEEISIEAGMTDYWMLLKATLSGTTYEFFFGSCADGQPTLNIFDRKNRRQSQPDRTFVLMGAVDKAKNTYPILELTCETNTMWSRFSAMKFVTTTMKDDGTVEEIEVTPEEVMADEKPLSSGSIERGIEEAIEPESGLKVDFELDEEYGEAGFIEPSVPGRHSMNPAGYVKSLFGKWMADGVRTTVQSIGIPVAMPGEIVSVNGVGPYGGLYGVHRCTHTLGGGGYTTTFEMTRGSLGAGHGSQDVDHNKQDAREDDEASVREGT